MNSIARAGEPRDTEIRYQFVDDADAEAEVRALRTLSPDASPHLASKLAGNADFVAGTLADVVEGRCAIDRTRTVVFSPFGLGVLDVAVGQWVYNRAVAEGATIQVPDFFG